MKELPDSLIFDVHSILGTRYVKFFGFYADSKLRWDKHINVVSIKISHRVGITKLCKFISC